MVISWGSPLVFSCPPSSSLVCRRISRSLYKLCERDQMAFVWLFVQQNAAIKWSSRWDYILESMPHTNIQWFRSVLEQKYSSVFRSVYFGALSCNCLYCLSCCCHGQTFFGWKTCKSLKSMLLIGQDKTKCVNSWGNPLSKLCTTQKQTNNKFTYLLPVGCLDASGRKRAQDWCDINIFWLNVLFSLKSEMFWGKILTLYSHYIKV